jgi:predicted TIM-barrel fold metal-dependent hydrolase
MTLSPDHEELHHACFEVPVIDTHEHLASPPELYRQAPDFLSTLQEAYLDRDLLSAGLGMRRGGEVVFDVHRPLGERIDAWWPAWQATANTGYARMVEIACRDLFGVEEINPSTVPLLNQRMAESRKPGWLEHCLERAGIEALVKDPLPDDYAECPPRFRFTLRVDAFTRNCLNRHALYPLEERTGVAIHSLDDMARAMRRYIEQGLATSRVAAFKTSHAYFRPVAVDEMNRAEAERAFERLVHLTPDRPIGDPWGKHGADTQLTSLELKPLHDYLYHHLFGWAEEFDRPVQIHLGFQTGSGNFIQNSNPVDLIPIFLRYPRVRFVILHAGFPYWREAGAIAKAFPNVFLDLCFVPIISPLAARRILDEWIDSVPANKIFAFGGDVHGPERAYGHSRIARDVVFRVMYRRVTEEGLSQSQALRLARRLLYENAKSFFGF